MSNTSVSTPIIHSRSHQIQTSNKSTISSLDSLLTNLTDEELDDTPEYGKVQKMTTEFEELKTKMTSEVEKLISSISIEELNKVGERDS